MECASAVSVHGWMEIVSRWALSILLSICLNDSRSLLLPRGNFVFLVLVS